MRRLGGLLAVGTVLSLGVARPVLAHTNLEATLDVAQEVPAPTGTLPGAGGTATFELDDETKMLSYTVTVQNLTGAANAAHIHQGAPGVAGPIVIPLDEAATSATVGPLTDAQVTALFAGLLYINFHTELNPLGEVRGQIELVAGKCACDGFPNHGKFVKCVRAEVKKLDKTERQEEGIKALKKNSAKSACGKKKAPKKSIACCVPRTPESNIVTDALCVPTKEAKCGALGGTSKGASSTCVPNPCSPSGAFLDGADIF